MEKRKKGRKVALVAGLALVVLSVAMVWAYWGEIRSWYAFRRDFERLGKNEQGYPEYRHRETGIVFVGLPGGTFDMGSPESEAGRKNEGPVHKVTLSPFLIAKYEVSQTEWKRVMGSNPSRYKGDALPVETVSWADCKEFCETTGLSLPTEAQWEYACRAGTPGKSRVFAGFGNLDDIFSGSGRNHPVRGKQPNDFGLHYMHANAIEWCEDWYKADFYQESAGARDPLCENSGSEVRVARGDGFFLSAAYYRPAYCFTYPPSFRFHMLGFRPAWSSP